MTDINFEQWVEDEFGEHPAVKAGRADESDLGFLDNIAHAHVVGAVLYTYKALLKGRFLLDLFVSKSLEPGAFVLRSKKSGGLGVAVLTVGLFRALAALSARACIYGTEEPNPLFYFLRRDPLPGSKARLPQKVLLPFRVSERKLRLTGLQDGGLPELCDLLVGTQVHSFLEIFCASIEFMLIHEMGHVLLRHQEAIDYFQFEQRFIEGFDRLGLIDRQQQDPRSGFTPRARFLRMLEHQADYFALRTMFWRAPERPDVSALKIQHQWTKWAFSDRLSRKMLAFVGAGVCFMLTALLQAPEPTEQEFSESRSLRLQESAQGGHPLPSVRLAVATQLLGGELSQWWRRMWIWPSRAFSGKTADQVGIVGFVTHVVCGSLLHTDWRNVLNGKEPRSQEVRRELISYFADCERHLGPTFPADFELARRIVQDAASK